MALIKGNAKKNVLIGTSAADSIFGFGNSDKLFGGDGNDTLFGGAGNDALNGGLGADRMSGGLGNDTYVVDDKGDRTIEKLDQGIDTVRSALAETRLGANVENLVLTGHTLGHSNFPIGTTGSINGTGNALDNIITGNNVSNLLSGVAGDDTLYGGGGRDGLFGGAGSDELSGGAGADTLSGDDGFDLASYQSSKQGVTVNLDVTVGAGFSIGTGGDAQGDRLTGIEGLIGSNFSDDLTGKVFVSVVGGVVQNSGTFLIGGGGNDILHGTGLNDFILDGIADLGFANGVTDPFLKVIGSGDDTLFGGDGNDSLFGGIGNDTIFGGSDSDTIAGGAGADHMTGRSPGNPETNTYEYLATTDSGVGAGLRDVITDFAHGDKIDLSRIGAATDPQFKNDPFAFGGQQPQGHIASFALSVPNPTPEVSFYFQGSNTIVQGYISDNHGNAINRFEIELTGHIVLTANDFVL